MMPVDHQIVKEDAGRLPPSYTLLWWPGSIDGDALIEIQQAEGRALRKHLQVTQSRQEPSHMIE